VITYFDTSALVKLLIHEHDSNVAAALWDASALRLTSMLTFAECRAALAAARRARRLTPAQARDARTQLNEHWDELAHVAIDETLVKRAGDLADNSVLRGYDAVHLASALTASEGGVLAFITWDRPLRLAAHRAGLATPT
jgi:predicted nucleic acid-binding protein